VQLSGISQYQHVWRHVRNCVLGLPALVTFAWRWLWKRTLARHKLPSVVLYRRQQVYNLHFDAEQSAHPESRVFLGEERDAFGQRQLAVDWFLTPQDVRSVLDSIRIVAAECERCKVGSLEIDDEMLERIARGGVGSHHIGTTRMAAHPEHGVVDRDCRVFGVSNLFIASSSTFPTGGCANPTLTIIAMAVRVADHLKRTAVARTTIARHG
jgi:choline dehydrogenase-like flavoprotein